MVNASAAWLALVALLLAFAAHAHDPGLSTATVRLAPERLEAVLVFSMRDIATLIELDKDRNGIISPEELAQRDAKLHSIAGHALEVTLDGKPVASADARCRFDENDNASVYLNITVGSFSNLVVRSAWLNSLPPGHRQYFSLENPAGGVLAQRMLSANSDTITVQMDALSAKKSFADFLVLGVKHIWTGYDHLLFLFGLLIVTRNFMSSLTR